MLRRIGTVVKTIVGNNMIGSLMWLICISGDDSKTIMLVVERIYGSKWDMAVCN